MNVLDMLKAPWAIEQGKLTEICAIYAAHRNGEARNTTQFFEPQASAAAASGFSGSSMPTNYEVQDGVALIPVEGILSKRMSLLQQVCGGMSYASLQQNLAQSLADSGVKAIILTVDSAGGVVDGVQAASDAIYAARSQKPIVSLVDGAANSAAYWLASSASKIYISADTDQVGSIGVITQHIDTSAAEALRGVKYTDITAGRYKAVGSSHRRLSGQDFGIIQDQLDHLYGIFVDTVARNRGVDVRTVLSKMADGRIFIGQKAIHAGLADGKTTLPALIQKLQGQASRPVASYPISKPRPAQTAKPIPDAKYASSPLASPAPPTVSIAAPALSTAQVPATAPLTAAQLQIKKLRALKAEENHLRESLPEARKSENAANAALVRAARAGADRDRLANLVTAKIEAENHVRSIIASLRSNDIAQAEVLRG